MKTALRFPLYYGRNRDAFWDSLTYESPVDFAEEKRYPKISILLWRKCTEY